MLRAIAGPAADYSLFANRAFYNFKPSNTRNLRKGLARVRAGTGRLNIACLGDSTTAGTGANTGTSGQAGAYPYAYPALLKSILNSRLATAIDGAVFGQSNGGVVGYGTFDTRVTLGAGWGTSIAAIGSLWYNNSTTNAFAFTPTEQVDTAIVWYVRNGTGATFTIDVDGGAALATVNANGASGFLGQTVTFTKGAHTINVKRNGTGTDLYLGGIIAYDSTAPSISVWNWGYHGTTSTTWNSTTNAWSPANAVAAIAPDVVIYGLGINDMGVTDVTTFKTNVQAIITKALIAGDCIIAIPNPVSTGAHAQSDQDAIRQALLDLACTNDLPVIDRYTELESYTQANANGWMYDTLHPNKLGYAAVASLTAKALVSAAG
jgi:lysophospholipase L1-like esterase